MSAEATESEECADQILVRPEDLELTDEMETRPGPRDGMRAKISLGYLIHTRYVCDRWDSALCGGTRSRTELFCIGWENSNEPGEPRSSATRSRSLS